MELQRRAATHKKELETEIAERSCQIQSQKGDQKARDVDKAGNAEKSGF